MSTLLPSKPSALLALALLPLLACSTLDETFDDDKADDLQSGGVYFERDEPIPLQATPSYLKRVETELVNHVPERSVTWKVQDFRLMMAPLQSGTFDKGAEYLQFMLRDSADFTDLPPELQTTDSDTVFGFKVEARVSMDGEWALVKPIDGITGRYYWTSFFLDSEGRISGEALKVSDAWGGTSAIKNYEGISRNNQVLARGAEFRITVFPIWDYWSFDEEFSYQTLLSVDYRRQE